MSKKLQKPLGRWNIDYCDKIINKIKIGEGTTVGAGALVHKNLPPHCTAVGFPAKPIKFHND